MSSTDKDLLTMYNLMNYIEIIINNRKVLLRRNQTGEWSFIVIVVQLAVLSSSTGFDILL